MDGEAERTFYSGPAAHTASDAKTGVGTGVARTELSQLVVDVLHQHQLLPAVLPQGSLRIA